MIYQEFLPSKPLQPFIHRYIIAESPTPNAFPIREFIPPNFCKVLVIHYCEEIDVRVDNGTFNGKVSMGYIQFQGTKKFLFESHQKIGLVTATFKPGQFRHFFPFPAEEFIDSNLSFEDYNHKGLIELKQKIIETKSNQHRILLLDNFLRQQLQYHSIQKSRTDQLVQLMFEKEDWKLQTTAAMLKVSERHLRRTFMREVGMAPKQLHKLLRFTKTLYKLQSRQFDSLKHLAYSSGYADPNHFIEHFKIFTGYTPSAYLKKLFPATATVLKGARELLTDSPELLI